MRHLLRMRPAVVSRSNHIFAPLLNWSIDLTARLHTFTIRPLRHVTTLFTTERFYASEVEKERARRLRIEQSFIAGPIGREIATLAERFTDRTRRVEERVANMEAVTVVRGNAEARGIERTDVPVRVRPESNEGHAPWGRSARRPESPVPAINFEQITENVMRQIDHRLTAWRERTGRS